MTTPNHDHVALRDVLRYPAVRDEIAIAIASAGLDDRAMITSFERDGYEDNVPLLVLLAEAACVRVLWDLTKEGRCSGVFDLNDDSSPTILAAHVAALRACGAEEDEDDAHY